MAAANRTLAAPCRLTIRCAIYTRKSTEEGLEQEFNTLDAKRDAAEAFIRRQRGEAGWRCPITTRFGCDGEARRQTTADPQTMPSRWRLYCLSLGLDTLMDKVYNGRSNASIINASNTGRIASDRLYRSRILERHHQDESVEVLYLERLAPPANVWLRDCSRGRDVDRGLLLSD